jgi:alpha-tubulin suppressor-like RCC1 family protein
LDIHVNFTLFCSKLSDSGDVFAWGDGSSGQLGAANIQLQPTPKLVASLYTALREAAKATAAPANPAAQEAPAAQDLKVPVGTDGLVTIKKFRAESEEARRARMKCDTVTDIACGAHFSAALTGTLSVFSSFFF